MAKDVTLVYSGPPVRVVEIDREVVDGDEVKVGPDLAPKLLAASGFREKGKDAPSDTAAEIAPRSVLEDRATALGLQLYPTEADEALASRIKSHGGNAEPGGEEPAKETPAKGLTPKQKVEAQARELGVSASGTKAEIEERIEDAEKNRVAVEAGQTDDGNGDEGQTE